MKRGKACLNHKNQLPQEVKREKAEWGATDYALPSQNQFWGPANQGSRCAETCLVFRTFKSVADIVW